MMNDFREIAPTFVLFAPRVWESIAADVRAGVMDSSPLKQKLYDLGMKTGLAALAEGKHSRVRRQIAVPRAARSPWLRAAAFGRHRRRGAGPGHVQVLPGDGRAAAHALRPDRIARRLHAASGRQGRSGHDRRADGRRYPNPYRQPRHQRRRRNRGASPQYVSRLLQEPGSLRRRHEGWLDAFRRCRLFQRQQAARGHRPHQGSRRDLARRALLAAISGKQAEVLALHRRNRRARRRPRRAGGDDLHPLLDHLEMGGEEPHLVHDLHRPLLPSRSLCAGAQGSRNRQRDAAAGAAYFALPAAVQGTRRRRRRTDAHAKGSPQRHQRKIRRNHRRDLWRQARHSRRYRHPFPGRHHPAHPHHAAGGRPRRWRRRSRRPRNEHPVPDPAPGQRPRGRHALWRGRDVVRADLQGHPGRELRARRAAC